MFTVLPRLGVVGNSAIMNVEPVFRLVLAWLILGQAIAPVQIAGRAAGGGRGRVGWGAQALGGTVYEALPAVQGRLAISMEANS
jgi:hypothetical protein